MNRSALAIAVAGALLGGCAPSHVYQPLDHVAAKPLAGRPAAFYPVPGGRVEVATVGTRKVETRRQIVVRLLVVNDSAAPWAIDPLRQEAILDGDGISRPPDHVRVGKNASIAPIGIPAHQQRTIDLGYFLDGDTPPERVSIAWRLATPTALVHDRASFLRARVIAAYTNGPPSYQGYYYRPFYDTYPFHGWDSPRRALPLPDSRNALVVPMSPPVEDAPPGGYRPNQW